MPNEESSFGVSNFTNIDNEDFVGMFDGKKATVKKGKTVAFPANIAKHLAGQLAAKILLKKDADWNKDPRRPGIIAEILGEEIEEEEKTAGIIKPLKPVKNFEPGEEPKEEAPEETKKAPKEEGEFEEAEEKGKEPEEAPKEEPKEDPKEEEKKKEDYSNKSFNQLKKIAKKAGITLKGLNSKAKLIKALK